MLGPRDMKYSDKWNNNIFVRKAERFPFNVQRNTMNIIILGVQISEDSNSWSLDNWFSTIMWHEVTKYMGFFDGDFYSQVNSATFNDALVSMYS